MTSEFDADVTVVVPALDEEDTIGPVVAEVLAVADGVVVVDDGSTDATARIAAENGATVIEHEENRGYDKSLSDGFAEAARTGADVVVTFDADGQHRAAEVADVVRPIVLDDADVVVGRRPRPARLAESLFAQFSTLRIGIDDPLSGFKAYDVDIYREVGYFDELQSIGTHLLFAATHRGATLEQVDISIDEREDDPRLGGLHANISMLSAFGSVVRFDLESRLRRSLSTLRFSSN